MRNFTKMHGLGNDYVYMNNMNQKIKDESSLAKFVSNRHFGRRYLKIVKEENLWNC